MILQRFLREEGRVEGRGREGEREGGRRCDVDGANDADWFHVGRKLKD